MELIRPLTTEEMYNSRVSFYRKNRDKFTDSQYVFLESILSTEKVTLKQMKAFLNTVNAVWSLQLRKTKI